MKRYKVVPLTTGCVTGSLDPKKLEDLINEAAQKGGAFERSIHETEKVALIFSREAHFLIFSREE